MGAMLPILAWLLATRMKWRASPWLGFFAGFCLLANGGYIGLGGFDRIGDAGDLLDHGSPKELLWGFGLTCCVFGIWLWHLLGMHSSRVATQPAEGRLKFGFGFAGLAMLLFAIL